MTVLSAVLAFGLLAGLLTIIPGLDTALVLRAALTQNRRHAFATALGINTGALVWGAAAAVGISSLLRVSSTAYTALRLAGAAYMLWLGAKMLRSAMARPADGSERPSVAAQTERPVSPWRSWSRGLLTNLLNPKIGAFYVAVLPQFIPTHTSHLVMGLVLAAVHDLEGLIWFSVIIFGAGHVRDLLVRPSGKRAVDAITGTALLGFGARLSLSPR